MKNSQVKKSKFTRLTFLLLLLIIGVNSSYAQKRVITGTVVDDAEEPLVGATVLIKGTSKGTATNLDGKFSLELSGDNILVVSSIGFKAQEVKTKNNKTLYIKMDADNQSLDEVVVIGYGQSTKRDLTGSMAKVNMSDVSKASVASITDALGGRISGVSVSSNDGQPGVGSVITIRGNSSLTGDNSPLYVVDGFPLEDPNLNSIPPEDIESLDVLKDASSTAIYGARGANGVIIITTKKGKVGKPQISYDGSLGFQKTTKRMDLMGPYDFVKMYAEYEPQKAEERYFTNGRTLESYKGAPGLDFQDEVMQTASVQNHNLSMRGGTESTRYSVSLNYLNQEGVIKCGGFDRFQGKVVLDQNINKYLKVGINFSYSQTKQYGVTPSESSYSSASYIMSDVWGYRPVSLSGNIEDIINSDRDPNDVSTDLRFNPLVHIQNAINDKVSKVLDAKGYLELNLLKDLKLKVSGGVNKYTKKASDFYGSRTKYGHDSRIERVNGQIITDERDTWLNENVLTYNKKINKDHKLNIVAGFTLQGATSNQFGARSILLPNESLGLSGLDLGTPVSIKSSSSEWKMASFLGRVNYDYKSKYLLTASMRADGSSKFSKENYWSYFPSGAFAWRIVEENFIKNNFMFVSDFKFRASWGITGNNRVGDFASLAQMNGAYYYNGDEYSAIIPTALENKTLRWENTAQTNLGVDLGFLGQRLTLVVDVYKKKTYDLLLNSRMPGSTGYTSAMKNIGKVENKGLEITLNTINVQTKGFEWSTNFNISFNRNKVLELAEEQNSYASVAAFDQNYKNVPAYIAIVGQPMAQMIGFVSDGLYQESHFDRTPSGGYLLKGDVPCNTPSRSNAVAPGHIKFKDLNHDGIINSNDYAIIGNPNPLHTGGFSNSFVYKGFDVNIFFQWSYGNDVYNANRLLFESSSILHKDMNRFATFADRWTPENTNATIPVIRGSAEALGRYYSSDIVEDGSFLRLKTVALGYTLPTKIIKKIGLSRLRLYASAQNIYTWTSYSGYDPEVSSRHSALTPGFDFSTYPRAFTVTFGLNATF